MDDESEIMTSSTVLQTGVYHNTRDVKGKAMMMDLAQVVIIKKEYLVQ